MGYSSGMRRGVVIALAVVIALILGGWLVAQHMLGSDLVRSTLEQQLSDRLGQPVHIGAASASIYPRVGVDLRDVTIGSSSGITVGRVQLGTGLRALLSHQIANAEVVVADGRIPWPLPFALTPTSSSGGASTGITITSINRIAFQNITIVSSLPPLTVSLDAALDGDRIEIGQLDARTGKTRLHASGALDSISRMSGTLNVTGDLEVDGYDATGLSATVALAHDTITLAPLAFGILNGRFQGRLVANLAGAAPRVEVAGDVTNVDMAQVMQRSGAPGALTGKLHGHIQVSAVGSDGTALVRTASGKLNVEIANGTIPHLDLVRTVVLAFGKPDAAASAGSGSAFDSLGGPFALANGTVSSDALALRSRDFDMDASGRLHLESGAVDSRGNVVLSSDLTAQAGTDLRRYAAQDGRVIVPVTVSGTLTKPTPFVDVAAAAQRAVGNEVKRRLGKFVGGLIKKKGGG